MDSPKCQMKMFKVLLSLCGMLFFIIVIPMLSDHSNQRTKILSTKVISKNTTFLTLQAASGQNWLIVDTSSETIDSVCSTYASWYILAYDVQQIRGLNCKTMETILITSIQDRDDSLKLVLDLVLQVQPRKVCLISWKDSKENHCNLKEENSSIIYLNSNLINGTKSQLFNMEHHFGCPKIDNSYDKIHEANVFHVCSVNQLLVTKVYLNQNCNAQMPALALTHGNYHIVPLFGTVFSRDHLWTLGFLHEASKTDASSAFVINILIQKLIALTGGMVKYHYTKTSESHPAKWLYKSLPQTTGEIISKINSLKCNAKSLDTCAWEYVTLLNKEKLLDYSIMDSLQKWNSQIKSHTETLALQENMEIFYSDFLKKQCDPSQIQYKPVKVTEGKVSLTDKSEAQQLYEETCKDNVTSPQYKVNQGSFKEPFPDILLIMLFNRDTYTTLPYLEMIYSSFFPHIIYCGPILPDIRRFPLLFDKDGRLKFTFIAYTHRSYMAGGTNYQCAFTAMTMGYNVKGYMFAADDTLVNVKKIMSHDFDRHWFTEYATIFAIREPLQTVYNFKMEKIPEGWMHYRICGKKCNRTMTKLMEMAHSNNVYAKTCIDNLKKKTGGEYRVLGKNTGDYYYIPEKLSKIATTAISVFLENDVFLEIAVTTLMRCIDAEEFYSFSILGLWDNRRRFPWSHFSASHLLSYDVVHPIKWSTLSKTEPVIANHKDQVLSSKVFLCNEVMPYFYGLKKPSNRTL